MNTSTKVNTKKMFQLQFYKTIIYNVYNNPIKVDHQIFYSIKINQQKKHLILECLLPNPMNHHHKGEG